MAELYDLKIEEIDGDYGRQFTDLTLPEVLSEIEQVTKNRPKTEMHDGEEVEPAFDITLCRTRV
jgi:hypothetical protein